jgi:hypothetical protein
VKQEEPRLGVVDLETERHGFARVLAADQYHARNRETWFERSRLVCTRSPTRPPLCSSPEARTCPEPVTTSPVIPATTLIFSQIRVRP